MCVQISIWWGTMEKFYRSGRLLRLTLCRVLGMAHDGHFLGSLLRINWIGMVGVSDWGQNTFPKTNMLKRVKRAGLSD